MPKFAVASSIESNEEIDLRIIDADSAFDALKLSGIYPEDDDFDEESLDKDSRDIDYITECLIDDFGYVSIKVEEVV